MQVSKNRQRYCCRQRSFVPGIHILRQIWRLGRLGGQRLCARDSTLTMPGIFVLGARQVVETANPRLVQPRHAAVKIRTRRTKFNRRREAEAGLTAKLTRNAGVISRNASVAEVQERGRKRQAVAVCWLYEPVGSYRIAKEARC